MTACTVEVELSSSKQFKKLRPDLDGMLQMPAA